MFKKSHMYPLNMLLDYLLTKQQQVFQYLVNHQNLERAFQITYLTDGCNSMKRANDVYLLKFW